MKDQSPLLEKFSHRLVSRMFQAQNQPSLLDLNASPRYVAEVVSDSLRLSDASPSANLGAIRKRSQPTDSTEENISSHTGLGNLWEGPGTLPPLRSLNKMLEQQGFMPSEEEVLGPYAADDDDEEPDL